jgi:hypothetical protein
VCELLEGRGGQQRDRDHGWQILRLLHGSN